MTLALIAKQGDLFLANMVQLCKTLRGSEFDKQVRRHVEWWSTLRDCELSVADCTGPRLTVIQAIELNRERGPELQAHDLTCINGTYQWEYRPVTEHVYRRKIVKRAESRAAALASEDSNRGASDSFNEEEDDNETDEDDGKADEDEDEDEDRYEEEDGIEYE